MHCCQLAFLQCMLRRIINFFFQIDNAAAALARLRETQGCERNVFEAEGWVFLDKSTQTLKLNAETALINREATLNYQGRQRFEILHDFLPRNYIKAIMSNRFEEDSLGYL